MVDLKLEALAEPLMFGRQQEFCKLQDFLDLALAGKGTTIFISGEAGSGKTRLATEFLAYARDRGVAVLTGWCLSNAASPYFPFVEAFSSYSNSNQYFSVLQQKLESTHLQTGVEAHDWRTPEGKEQFYLTITKELFQLSTTHPLIVFIDDLHWADSASLSLLHYIARAILHERLLILATFRNEELHSESGEKPLIDTLRLMARESLFHEVKLSNLSKPDVVAVTECVLKGNIDDQFAGVMVAESQGNPLFVVESIRMLVERKEIGFEAGKWRFLGGKLRIPGKVKDIILRRLSFLRPEQRRLLDAASVIGDIFNAELLGEVLNESSLHILELLNEISRFNCLVCCEGPSFIFDHARSREALYEEIRLPLRLQYHARIAETLERKSEQYKGFHTADLAYHFKQAGICDKAAKYSIEAGKKALSNYSNAEAINHFTYVLEITTNNLADEVLRKTAMEGLAEAYFANNQLTQAMRTFEQVSRLSVGTGKLHALRRAMDSAFFLGEFRHLLELTKEAETLAAVDRLENARVIMNRGRATLFLGNVNGLADFERALKVFEEECSIPDIALTLCGLSGSGTRKGLGRALLAVALYEHLEDERGLIGACFRAGQSFSYRMLTEKALDMFNRAVQICKKTGNYNKAAEATASSSWVLEAIGDWNQALSKTLEALDLCKKTDSEWVNAIVYSNLVRQNSVIGRPERSKEFLAKIDSMNPDVIRDRAFVKLGLSKAVFLAAQGIWQDGEGYFSSTAMFGRKQAYSFNPSLEIIDRLYLAWFLQGQNRIKEAHAQTQIAMARSQEIRKRFLTAAIGAEVLTPKAVEQNSEFTIQIYLINVSFNSIAASSIEGIISEHLGILKMPPFCSLKNSKIIMGSRRIEGFDVQPLNFAFRAMKTGTLQLKPWLTYTDNKGIKRKGKLPIVTITIKPKLTVDEHLAKDIENSGTVQVYESSREQRTQYFEFNTHDASAAFSFLLKCFANDYMKQRLAMEKAGWRSLMQIAKGGKISRYHLYGVGRSGPALSELQRRGLVEARIFPGERGRGGKILKVRVSYDKELVRRQVDFFILKPEKSESPRMSSL